jgi:hypothetical protein
MNKSIIKCLHNKFTEVASVTDAYKSGRPKVLMDTHAVMIKSPKKFVQRLMSQSGMSVSSAHDALKKPLHMYHYKVKMVHELLP